MTSEVRLIDANALQRLLLPIAMGLEKEYGSLGGAITGVMAHVDAAPTIDPENLRPKGRWELDVKSFYMDNYDESCELCVYIVATCSECGKKHPSSGQVFSRHLYAPEDANEDFRFDEDEEKAKALDEYKASLKNGVSTLANYCPNCGAKMEG